VSCVQTPQAPIASRVERTTVPAGDLSQLGDGEPEHVMGIEHLDIFGSHSVPLQVDEGPGQDFKVGFGMCGSGFGHAWGYRHLQLLVVPRPDELAPHRGGPAPTTRTGPSR
jgi:hypothetical protein